MTVMPRSAQAIFGPPAVLPPGGMEWITTDCASGRATQSAPPRPWATPPGLAVIPASGSSVEESQSSFGGVRRAGGIVLVMGAARVRRRARRVVQMRRVGGARVEPADHDLAVRAGVVARELREPLDLEAHRCAVGQRLEACRAPSRRRRRRTARRTAPRPPAPRRAASRSTHDLLLSLSGGSGRSRRGTGRSRADHGVENSCVCGFRCGSLIAPPVSGPLKRKTFRPLVISDS